MIDLFGLKAKQECQVHMRKIVELNDEIEELKRVIEMQSQRIEYFKNEIPFMYSQIDFPNSKGGSL